MDEAAALLGRLLPFECMQLGFMQRALLALLLLAPCCAAMGVQVVQLRLAFFSEAVGHSTLVGVAFGLLIGLDLRLAVPAVAAAAALALVALRRRARLSEDTATGVLLAAGAAAALAVLSRDRHAAREAARFLYGDVLTVGAADLWLLALLALAVAAFQVAAYNRAVLLAFDPGLARVHRRAGWWFEAAQAVLLAVVVAVAVRVAGLVLATALLVVPAASARLLARRAGAQPWWAVAVALTSAVAGLLLSAQPWLATATGATVVLCAAAWFVAALAATAWRRTS